MKITNKDMYEIICAPVGRCTDCIIGSERRNQGPEAICIKIFPANYSDEYLKEFDISSLSYELKNKIYEVVIEYKLKNGK